MAIDQRPPCIEKAMTGGLAMLIAQRLDFGRHAELPTIAPEAVQFVLTPYLGAEQARRIAVSREPPACALRPAFTLW